MDYVREELLRQNRVLEALLRTGTEQEQEPDRQETAERPRLRESRRGAAPMETEEAGGTVHLPAGRGSGAAERNGTALWQETAGDAADRRSFPERGISVLRRGEGAREVSRAIERDARRYDGGFTMY